MKERNRTRRAGALGGRAAQRDRASSGSAAHCLPVWARVAVFLLLLVGSLSLSHAATVPVTNTNDNLVGSLRQAIQDASPGDTVVFQIPTTVPGYDASKSVFTISLMSGELLINKNLTIDPGGQKIVIQRSSSAPSFFRIFNVTGGDVTLVNLTIANGFGGGVGGANILNAGNLSVRACTIRGGSAVSTAGGGVRNTGTLFVLNSTITSNRASLGAGIFNDGALTVRNSTIVGNLWDGVGLGYGITNASGGTAVLGNSIVVGNIGPGSARDVRGVFISEGYNLIGEAMDASGLGNTGDQVGATPAQANLTALEDHGGPTHTMRPKPGSVAIDQGKRGLNANNQPIITDQRGYLRLVDLPGVPNAIGGDGNDIGAVEVGPVQAGPTFTVTNTDDHFDAQCTSDDCTLIEAIVAPNGSPNTKTIVFALGIGSTIVNFNQSVGGYGLAGPVNIVGPGARQLAISGGNVRRIFYVTSGSVSISGLTLTNGLGAGDDGGAIYNDAELTLTDCTVKSSMTSGGGNGGGLFNSANATATLAGCTFTQNSADEFGGGGVFNAGKLTATNCTFYANAAPSGGGILSVSNNGNSLTTLRNCTIARNTATSTASSTSGGGGYYGEGAVGNSLHHFSNTIIAGNTNSVNPDLRGYGTSEGNNLVGNLGQAGSGFTNGVNGDKVGVANAGLNAFADNGGPTDTVDVISSSPAINAGNDTLAPPADQRGYGRNGPSDIGAFEFAGFLPVTLANISTRLRVETGDNVLIGGFIITGTENKRVIIRAIGPSLPFAGRLDNPTLELRDGAGTLLDSNDDWVNSPNRQAILDTTIPPANDFESAIVATLPAGAAGYTAIVRGANGGTGIGVVEAYDLDRSVDSKLANISTRGFVSTADNVLIAGTIVLGQTTQKVIIRAIAPSLPIAGKLENPTLELRDGNGALLEANDNWVDSPNKQAILGSTIPPANDLESAIVQTLSPAGYTAIVRGVNDSTGIAVVEVYALN